MNTNCHNPMQNNRPYLFVHHAETSSCSDLATCSQIVRGIQDWHINGNGWCDIGYSFLVGGDGNIYEGRGWDEIGAHTGGFNSVVSIKIHDRVIMMEIIDVRDTESVSLAAS